MKQSSILSSIIYLFVIIISAGLGLFLISLKWLNFVCEYLAKMLLFSPESFFPLGIIFLIASFLLIISFYSIFRYKHISISTKPYSCDVDGKIIKTYAKKCFEELLSIDHIKTEVTIFRDIIEIIAYLPPKNKTDENTLLERAEIKLSKILKEYFAYNKRFTITIKTL